MISLVLIPWAETDWSSEGRMAAATPVALNRSGTEAARRWGQELASCELAAIYRSHEKTAVQTADLVARDAEVRTRCVPELREVGVGLWEGLTHKQIQQRFPKVFRLWEEQPESICPPDGEDLVRAADRLRGAIQKIAQKHKSGAVGLILGPLAYRLARCHLEGRGINHMRELPSIGPVWYQLDGSPHPIPQA